MGRVQGQIFRVRVQLPSFGIPGSHLDVICQICHAPGHFIDMCPSRYQPRKQPVLQYMLPSVPSKLVNKFGIQVLLLPRM